MKGSKKKWQTLREAVQQNDVAQVKAAAGNLNLTGDNKYFDACITAIKFDAIDTLEALLEAGGGFNFSRVVKFWAGDKYPFDHVKSRERDENCTLAQRLIEEAHASENPGSFLPVLYKNRTNGNLGYGALSFEDFLGKGAPVELLEACLKDKSLFGAFRGCVGRTGLFSTEKLEFILSFAPDHEDSAAVINEALVKVAAAGDIDKAALLLAHWADADFNGAEALRSAARNKDQKMVDLLLPHVSLDKLGDNFVKQQRQLYVDPTIISSIEAATKNSARKAVAEAPSAPSQDDRFQSLDEDTLVEVKKLPDGSTLTTLFNFSARQQEKFVTNEAGIISPFPTVNFDDIAQDVIKAMREKLDALNNEKTASRPAINKLHL